ncbi:MAG: hypothetical protein RLZZ200_514 [Pseudomonadota bacterium]|jgi:hypothetical protein
MKSQLRIVQMSRDLRTGEQLARGAAIAQEQADQLLQFEFERRVRANLEQRKADGRYHPESLLETRA